MRHLSVTAVYLLLQRDETILLLQRKNTGYHDGKYGVIAGHVENGETFKDAMIREAKEEAGIIVDANDLEMIHVQHMKSDKDGGGRVHMYFTVSKWKGEIKNMEPHKCGDLSWFDRNTVPDNIVPAVKSVLEKIFLGEKYSEFGW